MAVSKLSAPKASIEPDRALVPSMGRGLVREKSFLILF